jgi:hypothetical protein
MDACLVMSEKGKWEIVNSTKLQGRGRGEIVGTLLLWDDAFRTLVISFSS